MKDSEKTVFHGGNFMPRITKVTPEEKALLVQRYLRGELRQAQASQAAQVTARTFLEWVVMDCMGQLKILCALSHRQKNARKPKPKDFRAVFFLFCFWGSAHIAPGREFLIKCFWSNYSDDMPSRKIRIALSSIP